MKRLSSWLAAAALGLAAAGGGRVQSAEIGFIETFSLASDRAAALKQLIPGTEDYYFFHALHYQNQEEWDKVDEIVQAWVKRYNYTSRVHEIENRQALLLYDKNPKRALDLIRNRLNLHFNHERELLNRKPNLPTALAPELISPQRLNSRAFSRNPRTVEAFEDAALDWLTSAPLDPDQRRHLLSRLRRPDYANLPKLVVDDLNYIHSGGFGQWPIHGMLLLSQLDELLKLKPDLRDQENFVYAYLRKLHPSDDVNWRQDPAATAAFLDRLWNYVKTLHPVHNSLKAHVLYRRLELDRSQGTYDAARLMEYLKLPRHVHYIEPRYMERDVNRNHPADLARGYGETTMLPPIGNDEPLVRSYLAHFFLKADDYQAYTPYVHNDYLKHLFAETKVVNGLGDQEQWFSWLPPAVYQQLKERIDLDFAPTNPKEFAVDELVSLEMDVKNVETLLVKVFEINTQNYYRENMKEVGPDVALDGLVANDEQTYVYKDPPLRRVRRKFDFPKLDRRGAYVIDFIGNGKSSRAVVRKGKLRFLVRNSVAGQAFKVLDERNQVVPKAGMWIGGRFFEADASAEVVVPYSSSDARQPIVLTAGGFSSLDSFQQEQESYRLDAGFYVDREQLLSLRKAELAVRPQLTLCGVPVTLKLLEDVRLTVTSTDLDGVVTTTEVPDFKLFEDRETVHLFQTPKRLASVQFTLNARVRLHSKQETTSVSSSATFHLNHIDRADVTEDLHFLRAGGNCMVDLLGKSGEPKADRPVHLELQMRDYKERVHVTLQTNAAGRIALGPLPGVVRVKARSPQNVEHSWEVRDDERTYTQVVQGEAGRTVEIPYMGAARKPERSELSLIEMRGEQFVADRFDAIQLENGMLKISDLPAGDYSLLLKKQNVHVRIRLAEGKPAEGYVLGAFRKLELPKRRPLQIRPVETTKTGLKIRLDNAGPLARVHVFATRFQPTYSAFEALAAVRPSEPQWMTAPRLETQYEEGRNIGDEYRYIIDRKFAKKFPGNMLERPSLLLNPWAVRSTATTRLEAQAGDSFVGHAMEGRGEYSKSKKLSEAGGTSAPGAFANLDFLASNSTVLLNLVPNEEGIVEIPTDTLGPHSEVLVAATDLDATVQRLVSLPEPAVRYLDLRLKKSLDPQEHFTQQKRISLVSTGGKLTVPDITSTQFETYDSLGGVYALYAALHADPRLEEFGFMRNWNELKLETKKALYKKHASHELNFFVYSKDPEFFKLAVKPLLANKKEKQFLDRWFLEEDLSVYVQPWNFERLSAFERILLGRRLAAERAVQARLLREQVDLIPPDVDRFQHLFRTALRGRALDVNRHLALGLNNVEAAVLFDSEAPEQAAGEKMEKLAEQSDAPRSNMGRFGGARGAPGPAGATAAAPAAPPRAMAPMEADRQAAAARKPMAKERMEEAAKAQAGKDALRRRDAKQEAQSELGDERKRVALVQQYYREVDKTMEWAESNWYKVPLESQNPGIVPPSSFWRDYADQEAGKPFLSTNVAEAARTFPEMVAAISVLDLPFKAVEPKTEVKGTELTMTASGPMIVFHEEIQKASKVAEFAPILVSQNFYRQSERYKQVGSEQLDKWVTEEFLVDVVYGCHLVVTNPTSTRKKVEALLQIPAGAMPVHNGQNTRSVPVDLQPYHTQTLEYFFYFPAAGRYPHYPVQIANQGEVLAFAQPFSFNVVEELTNIDKQSWDYVSQHGTPEDVLTYLKTQNVLRVDLARIAWRMKDAKFFDAATKILDERRIYNQTLWSYGVAHDRLPQIQQFLQFSDGFVDQCGAWLSSKPLTIDPVARKSYEHLDYRPLINARVGKLGRNREILNDRFYAQYQRMLRVLSYRPKFEDRERLEVAHYLLLQDRVDEAAGFFEKIRPENLDTRVQYDYYAAYLDFSKGEPKLAATVAAKYADYPVERWRAAFASIAKQAAEIDKPAAEVVDADDRGQATTNLAAASPSFDFTVESQQVRMHYQHLKQVRVNYYQMDVELLFSRSPFVQHDSKQFSHIQPNFSQVVDLPADAAKFTFPLPEKLQRSNLLVEIVGSDQTRSQAYYANALRVQLTEGFGQARVVRAADDGALGKVYVKVYARMNDGEVKFFKDGYTDLRGRFEYASLSTDELSRVEKFSLLVLSDEFGAVVREAAPPKR